MRTKLAILAPLVGLLLVTLTPVVKAASLKAFTEVCNGYFGSAAAPELACAPGGVIGGGVIIPGGSGVGSGFYVPFYLNPNNGAEFSATAEALQDYGVFRGYASIHTKLSFANIYGGVYRAQAAGDMADTWTFTNGVGTGLLNLAFTIDGVTTASSVAVGGQGNQPAVADLSISLRASANGRSQTTSTCCVTSAGTYTLTPGTPGGIAFTYGEPFDVRLVTVVAAYGGFDRLNAPSFYQLDATAAFQHTAVLSGIFVTDLLGNPVDNFVLTAASGTQYPLAVQSPVPLPPSFVLLLGGLGVVGIAVRQRRRIR